MKKWIKVQLPQIMEAKTHQLESCCLSRNSFWGDKLKWDSASIDLTFSQGHGGCRGQMEGLNKSSVTAGAWLRAQDNTTKSLLTLSAPTDAFCPISRKNIDAAPKMSILQIYRYFPVLEMTFCVDGRNCPSRSRWEANKHPPPGENIVSEDSSNCSRFCHTCDLIKRFLLPTNILNRDIAVGQLNMIMYLY